jgi:hypothetical protein
MNQKPIVATALNRSVPITTGRVAGCLRDDGTADDEKQIREEERCALGFAATDLQQPAQHYRAP